MCPWTPISFAKPGWAIRMSMKTQPIASALAIVLCYAGILKAEDHPADAGVPDAGIPDPESDGNRGNDGEPEETSVNQDSSENENISTDNTEGSPLSDTGLDEGWGEGGGWGEEEGADENRVSVHGSYENQFNGMWLRRAGGQERVVLYDSNRLRIDVDANLGNGIEIRSNGVVQVFVGETEVGLLDLIPPATFDALLALDPRWSMVTNETYHFENEYYLDNAYIKIPIAKMLLTVGKQPLEQGAAYAWNPTDVFTRKDMFDPTYEKPGIVAARLVVPFGDTASIDLIGVPDGNFENWTGGGRASLRLGPISFSAVSYLTTVTQTDLEGSLDQMITAAMKNSDVEKAIKRSETRRILVGGDIVADIEGVRLWTEGAYNFIDDEAGAPANWWELCAGLEYYFPFETHLMAEYFHYGRGPKPEGGIYSFNDWNRLLAAELKMLGQDFLFESIDHPVSDFWTVGLSSFQGISEGSFVLIADVRWEFVEDAELWLMVSANIGEQSDFLSSTRGQGWLRLKAYF